MSPVTLMGLPDPCVFRFLGIDRVFKISKEWFTMFIMGPVLYFIVLALSVKDSNVTQRSILAINSLLSDIINITPAIICAHTLFLSLITASNNVAMHIKSIANKFQTSNLIINYCDLTIYGVMGINRPSFIAWSIYIL